MRFVVPSPRRDHLGRKRDGAGMTYGTHVVNGLAFWEEVLAEGWICKARVGKWVASCGVETGERWCVS